MPEGQPLAVMYWCLFLHPGRGNALRTGCCGAEKRLDEFVGAEAAAVGSSLGAPKEMRREARQSLVGLAHSLWFKLSECSS